MEPERGVVNCHAGAEGYKSPSAMSVVGKKKLQKELRDLNASPPAHIAAVTVAEKNLYDFYALCQGPDDTPYEGGWYIAKLRFPVSRVCGHCPVFYMPRFTLCDAVLFCVARSLSTRTSRRRC